MIRIHRKDCFCNNQFNVKACSVQGIFKTGDVVKNDPDSVACPKGTFDVTSEYPTSSDTRITDLTASASLVEQMVRFPIPSEEIDRFRALIGNSKPAKPYAFVFGHGLWNVRALECLLLPFSNILIPRISIFRRHLIGSIRYWVL